MKPGCLYVCATPIGNLEDVTLRVLRILGEVDVIAAEDTRRTRQLLSHYDIHTPLISLYEHNELVRAEQLISRLEAGQSVALVSDAGTPAISDPGHRLIRAVLDAHISVTVVPGPSAFVTALVGSGLPTERFVFEGFLPRSNRRRRAVLRQLAAEERTLVFYESPHRIRDTLQAMVEEWGPRPAAVARELTKAFEEWQRGTLAELAAAWAVREPRGEFVIVVAGAAGRVSPGLEGTVGGAEGVVGAGTAEGTVGAVPSTAEASEEQLAVEVRAAMAAGRDKKAAIKAVARALGVPRRTVYRAAIGVEGAGPRPDLAGQELIEERHDAGRDQGPGGDAPEIGDANDGTDDEADEHLRM